MLCAGAAVAALLAGCVTRGSYEEVVEERDGLAFDKRVLEEQLQRLEASRESLTTERVRLIDQLEGLREEHENLTADLERLRRARQELSQSLAKREAELSQVQGTYESLVSDLESEVAAGQIQIEQLREGLRVGVADEILFPSGSAELEPEGREVLRKVVAQLGSLPHRIEVEGHTDDVPIRGALQKRYPTNWELAGARAARVVRLFEEEGIDPERLTAVSYADNHPVAPNDTPAHRSKNRRIEIRLVPAEADAAAAPDAPAPTAASGE